MRFNRYEAPEVLEIGLADQLVLGAKDNIDGDVVGDPSLFAPLSVADVDE